MVVLLLQERYFGHIQTKKHPECSCLYGFHTPIVLVELVLRESNVGRTHTQNQPSTYSQV